LSPAYSAERRHRARNLEHSLGARTGISLALSNVMECINGICDVELGMVVGGTSFTQDELESACAKGEANPPQGMTPRQGCLYNVTNLAVTKTDKNWMDALKASAAAK
jgi:hypothetical protein